MSNTGKNTAIAIGKKGKIIETEIPFIEDSEIGSANTEGRAVLFQQLCNKGQAVPRDWLVKQLGGIKPASLHSLVRRYEYGMRTLTTKQGVKAIKIVPEKEPSKESK